MQSRQQAKSLRLNFLQMHASVPEDVPKAQRLLQEAHAEVIAFVILRSHLYSLRLSRLENYINWYTRSIRLVYHDHLSKQD